MQPQRSSAIELAIQTISAAVDATSQAGEGLEELSSLFSAIDELSVGHPGLSKALARIGRHMARDLGSLTDSRCEEITEDLTALRELKAETVS